MNKMILVIRTVSLNGICVIAAGLAILMSGCDSKSATTTESKSNLKSEYIDEAVTRHHNLGWLGATSNPVSESISFPDPDDADNSVAPGGIVIRTIGTNQIADKAGIEIGDVIVRVGEDWLPIKDDPTLDFMEKLEGKISGGVDEFPLGILRNGSYLTLSFEHGMDSLDEGMPNEVGRINSLVEVALQRLAEQQHNDGSFGDAGLSEVDRLKVTAIAGLALLGSSDDSFKAQIDKCIGFIAEKIDERSTKKDSPQQNAGTAEAAPEGLVTIESTEVNLDPLTSAYVLQFLAESKVQMVDREWLSRIMGMNGQLIATQLKSGGWNANDPSAEEGSADAEIGSDTIGTHTTNQVLLALGAWEGKGVMGQPEVISNACKYLKEQYELRAKEARLSTRIDRRVRAALTAGTSAALTAINCQQSDAFQRQLVKEILDRVPDMPTSPSLGSSGLVCSAIVARGGGKQDWGQFIRAVRIPLLSTLSPDGNFHRSPAEQSTAVVGPASDTVWHAASVAICLSMQNGNLKMLTGQATSPMQVVRNSDGEKMEGSAGQANAGMPNMPQGGTKMMTLTLDDLSGEGSMEDQIKEKLKEMGMDTDNIQFGKMGGPPPEEDDGERGKKKDK